MGNYGRLEGLWILGHLLPIAVCTSLYITKDKQAIGNVVGKVTQCLHRFGPGLTGPRSPTCVAVELLEVVDHRLDQGSGFFSCIGPDLRDVSRESSCLSDGQHRSRRLWSVRGRLWRVLHRSSGPR